MITNDWLPALKPEFAKPYYRDLYETVKREYETRAVYPPAKDIFNAFDFTPLSKVKVVIIGQDPYHEPGQATGLCFSVNPSVEIPPSLVNIYQELHDDLGCRIPNNGYLKNGRTRACCSLTPSSRYVPIRQTATAASAGRPSPTRPSKS